jgi:hypothetical protein
MANGPVIEPDAALAAARQRFEQLKGTTDRNVSPSKGIAPAGIATGAMVVGEGNPTRWNSH